MTLARPIADEIVALWRDANRLADELDALARERGHGPYRCLQPDCRGVMWRERDCRVCTKCGAEERVVT